MSIVINTLDGFAGFIKRWSLNRTLASMLVASAAVLSTASDRIRGRLSDLSQQLQSEQSAPVLQSPHYSSPRQDTIRTGLSLYIDTCDVPAVLNDFIGDTNPNAIRLVKYCNIADKIRIDYFVKELAGNSKKPTAKFMVIPFPLSNARNGGYEGVTWNGDPRQEAAIEKLESTYKTMFPYGLDITTAPVASHTFTFANHPRFRTVEYIN